MNRRLEIKKLEQQLYTCIVYATNLKALSSNWVAVVKNELLSFYSSRAL